MNYSHLRMISKPSVVKSAGWIFQGRMSLSCKNTFATTSSSSSSSSFASGPFASMTTTTTTTTTSVATACAITTGRAVSVFPHQQLESMSKNMLFFMWNRGSVRTKSTAIMKGKGKGMKPDIDEDRLAKRLERIERKARSGKIQQAMQAMQDMEEIGKIADSYIPLEKYASIFRNWSLFWKQALEPVKRFANKYTVIGKMHQVDKTFNPKQFEKDALALSNEVTEAIYRGDSARLEEITCKEIRERVLKKIKLTTKPVFQTVKPPKLVNLIEVRLPNIPFSFIQATVKITQTEGSSKDPITSYVVFERKLATNTKWKVVGKIDVQAVREAQQKLLDEVSKPSKN